MSDTLNKDATDKALGKAVEAEEFEKEGRKVKRDPEKLLRVRENLNAEFRVAENGNILERACHGVVKR
ncbi:MAG: hypothetical protein JEY79_05510 [Pseudodesulfovibrio sp.]|nr:hypothetical protein [Pseudodesulfovibrio sp.]